jgi:hypothetical protein
MQLGANNEWVLPAELRTMCNWVQARAVAGQPGGGANLAAPVDGVSKRRPHEGPRRSLERPSDQREDPLVMKDAMPLGVDDRVAARDRAGLTFRQQERVGQLPNPPLQRPAASCNSRSRVNMWSRRRGLRPRLIATLVLSTLTFRRR